MKDIGNYIIYEDGNLWSKHYKRYMVASIQRDSYSTYKVDGKTVKVHRLVAKSYIPNPQNKPEVNHKDGNKQNNHVSNLEWVTSSENGLHSYKLGLSKKEHLLKRTGINNPNYKHGNRCK